MNVDDTCEVESKARAVCTKTKKTKTKKSKTEKTKSEAALNHPGKRYR